MKACKVCSWDAQINHNSGMPLITVAQIAPPLGPLLLHVYVCTEASPSFPLPATKSLTKYPLQKQNSDVKAHYLWATKRWPEPTSCNDKHHLEDNANLNNTKVGKWRKSVPSPSAAEAEVQGLSCRQWIKITSFIHWVSQPPYGCSRLQKNKQDSQTKRRETPLQPSPPICSSTLTETTLI